MLATLKGSAKFFAGRPTLFHFARLLDGLHTERGNLLWVLTYHRVIESSDDNGCCPSTISASPERFAEQMAYLADHCHVVSMAEAIRSLRSGDSLPPRSVLITFDDAYQDFADNAWPVLQEHGLPATVFVPTAFPDEPLQFWWDRLYRAIASCAAPREIELPSFRLAITSESDRRLVFKSLLRHLKSLPHSDVCDALTRLYRDLDAPAPESHVMSWATLRRLLHDGVTLGAHTHTHPLLNRLSPQEAIREARQSIHVLRDKLDCESATFAYPGGAHTLEISQLLSREGVQLAFTTHRGVNDVQSADPLRLRRINIGTATTLPLLRLQLTRLMQYWSRLSPLPDNRDADL